MDPDAALEEFNRSGCWQALQDLNDWRAKGGFRPSGVLDHDAAQCHYDLGGRHADVVLAVQEWLEPTEQDARPLQS